MAKKRIKIKIQEDGNFDIEAVKGFANNECHHTIEAILGGMDATEVSKEDRNDYFDEPNLLANLR